jgi:hypothetical protein
MITLGRTAHPIKGWRRLQGNYGPKVRHFEKNLSLMVVIRFVGKAKTLTGKLLILVAARHDRIQPRPSRRAARRHLDAYRGRAR